MADDRTINIDPEEPDDLSGFDLPDDEAVDLKDSVARERALRRRYEDDLLGRLQRLEDAKQIVERRAELLETLQKAAIRTTEPEQWVLHRDREGHVIGIPSSAACARMAKLYGVRIFRMRPRDQHGNFDPDQIPVKDGQEVEFRGFCDARSNVTGEEIEQVEFSRRSDEEFIGRYDDMQKREGPWEGDLRKSVGTGLRTKAVRILTGTAKVRLAVLADAWKGTDKDPNDCTKGHGFGSAQARTARREAPKKVTDGADELWADIMRRTGGDEEAGRQVLREITSFTKREGGKFDGYSDHKRITSDKMLNLARKQLKDHASFGDKAMDGAGS